MSLQVGDEFIIIENKIKSMPDKEQLEKYWAKAKTDNKKLVLVSYFKRYLAQKKIGIIYLMKIYTIDCKSL